MNAKDIDKRFYPKYAAHRAEKSKMLQNIVNAFLVGGTICTLGQLFFEIYHRLDADVDTSRTLASITIVLVTALLTGFGIFDDIAKHAGAGTLVPISGFANSVVAPAIDNKAEGWITGLGTKIFIIAGPVILYGTFASVVCGVIYFITTLF
ncbi:MAG: SpoVA/SpoVAEb family sporulation membrane protein [Ruminococcaceae bacterium]|nr:SpoVA/SpoVAEb family sporulation membrane protein [Oscillospiraceae bacterium]